MLKISTRGKICGININIIILNSIYVIAYIWGEKLTSYKNSHKFSFISYVALRTFRIRQNKIQVTKF